MQKPVGLARALLVILSSVAGVSVTPAFAQSSVSAPEREAASSSLPTKLSAASNDIPMTGLSLTTFVGEIASPNPDRSIAAARAAIFAASERDVAVRTALAGTGAASLTAGLRQFLPDHAGGVFEVAMSGSRAMTRLIADHSSASNEGRFGLWIAQAGWGSAKPIGETAGYSNAGWGVQAGMRQRLGSSEVGASLAYANGQTMDRKTANEVVANQYEVAGYWRAQVGGLHTLLRGSVAHASIGGRRFYDGTSEIPQPVRTIDGNRTGRFASATALAFYDLGRGPLSVRPTVSLDYFKMTEGAYVEGGGGPALDLSVGRRASSEAAATFSLTAVFNFSGGHGVGADEYATRWRLELEGGRRQLLTSRLGQTTASFQGGQRFTLVPEARSSGWVSSMRLTAANGFMRASGEIGGEALGSRWGMYLSAKAQFKLD